MVGQWLLCKSDLRILTAERPKFQDKTRQFLIIVTKQKL